MTGREQELYDDLLDGEPPTPCPVCTGDRNADPCSEGCDLIARKVALLQLERGLYEQARKALRFARLYRGLAKCVGFDHRAVACLVQVRRIRNAIRVARWTLRDLEAA